METYDFMNDDLIQDHTNGFVRGLYYELLYAGRSVVVELQADIGCKHACDTNMQNILCQ